MADEVIGGYRLANHMMTGQTSQVWEVIELASGRHFAMKMLLPERASDREHRRLLFHEAEVGKRMAHPNVIKIFKIERSTTNPFFIMEFFPAGSLRLKLKQTEYIRTRIHGVFKQAATALAYMNASGWVHRDVKPDNILCNAAGEVRLIDFALSQRIPTGLAKMFWRRKTAQGTRSYMSPEQIRGQALDGRADVYSFGCMAYEVVAGRVPFRGISAQELLEKHIKEKPLSPQFHNPDVTDEFAALVLRMLAKKREDRPKDFHEVLMALRSMRVFKSQEAAPSEAG